MTIHSDILHYILLAYNFLSLALGILAIIACVFELDQFSQDVAQYTEDIVQLIAACVLVISAFIGCTGVTFQSIYSLGICLTVLIFLIFTHIWKLLRYDEIQLEQSIRSEVTYAWLLSIENKHSTKINKIQQRYECCGVDGFTDYIGYPKLNQSCMPDGINGGKIFIVGCVKSMQDYCLDIYRIEKLVHLFMVGYEAIGVLLTSGFIWQLFSKTRRYFY